MIKKYQIFISSTYLDLIDERQVAVEAVLDVGHIPAGMEIFKGGRDKMETIHKWIDESDIFLLLLGGCYGSVDEVENKSYTQLEYEYAISKNKPFIPIVLSEKYLLNKAGEAGKDKVFESKHKAKFNQFRKYIVDKYSVREVNTLEGISSAISTHIISILNHEQESDLNQRRWLNVSDVNDTANVMLWSDNKKREVYKKCLCEMMKKQYGDALSVDNSECISDAFLKSLSKGGYLGTSDRVIKLKLINGTRMKVSIANKYEYLYLDNDKRYFGFASHISEGQAITFKIDNVLINGDDYKERIQLEKIHENKRTQFPVLVKIKNHIPIQKIPVQIDFQVSYECSVNDFFMAYGLPYLCKSCTVEIILEGEIADKYIPVSSTFSPFSKSTADSYLANELREMLVHRIKLPDFSLSGSGYSISLAPKYINNNIGKSGYEE